MNEKTPDNFSRSELLALLQTQQQELAALRQKLQEAEEKLAAHQLVMAEAGSIAQAALQLNHVFESAQQAADQYLEGVETLSARQEADYHRRLTEAEQQVQTLLRDAQSHCRDMEESARVKSAYYWDSLSLKIAEFYRSHPELCQALAGKPEDNTPDQCFGPDD